VGADQRAVEGGPLDGRPTQVDLHGDRVALLAGAQRAGAVRERLRQHRLDLAGDVDARAAPVGLLVDERPRPHVGGDVGDVYPYAPGTDALAAALGGDRVVEVLRGGGVDRERREVAQVAAGHACDPVALRRGAR